MLTVLIYSVIPPMLLGRRKAPLARELHDKSLHVSAALNKGDWLSAIRARRESSESRTACGGPMPMPPLFISIEIIKDGYENVRNTTAQLMDKRPSAIESKEKDPAIAFVQPRDRCDLLARLEQARQTAATVDWRLRDVNIVPAQSLQ